MTTADEQWQGNYFNYFTEVEEHFQRARGTGLFLMSPLDWALIETWKNAGLPLEAVLRGIDEAFEKWRARKQRGRAVNSLAYCAQAVMEQAQILAGNAPASPSRSVEAPFSRDELAGHLQRITAAARDKGFSEVADSLAALDPDHYYAHLEELEQRLTALEEKLLALMRSTLPGETLFEARRDMDAQLRQYRGKFSADQLARLERQFLDRWLFERSGLPRFSIFYLR